MSDSLRGLQYFLDGFDLITKPGLKRYVIIPALINIAIFIGMFMIATHYMAAFNHWLVAHVPYWLAWLSVIVWLLFSATFILFFIYAFIIVANLVAAPFNSLLAEKVELYLTGNALQQKTIWDFLKDVPRIIFRQLNIIGYYLLRAMLILVLFFIPVVQSMVPFIWFVFSAWFIAITYMDYVTDNHQIPVTILRDKLNSKRSLTLVFGSCVLMASMIPIINFFTIPAAVAGATKLWLSEFKNT